MTPISTNDDITVTAVDTRKISDGDQKIIEIKKIIDVRNIPTSGVIIKSQYDASFIILS